MGFMSLFEAAKNVLAALPNGTPIDWCEAAKVNGANNLDAYRIGCICHDAQHSVVAGPAENREKDAAKLIDNYREYLICRLTKTEMQGSEYLILSRASFFSDIFYGFTQLQVSRTTLGFSEVPGTGALYGNRAVKLDDVLKKFLKDNFGLLASQLPIARNNPLAPRTELTGRSL